MAVKDESELKMLMLGDMMWTEFHGVALNLVGLAKVKFGRFYYYCSDGFTTPDGDDLSIEDDSYEYDDDVSEQDDASEEGDADSINSDEFAEDDDEGYDEEVIRLMKILYIV